MPSLWDLTDVEQEDAERSTRLRQAPPWPFLMDATCQALASALDAKVARFGLEESGRNPNDLRGIVQFPVRSELFDIFFNGTTGYRAQFRIDRNNGLAMNANLVRALVRELEARSDIGFEVQIIRRSSCRSVAAIENGRSVIATFDPFLTKVWCCERLIEANECPRYLYVSRTGPKLNFQDDSPWSAIEADDANAWLEMKGAFTTPRGCMYQVKSPEARATSLEERGSA